MPTATSVNQKYVPKGANDAIHFYTRIEVPVVMANGDTLVATLPAGVDPDALPTSVLTLDPVGGGVRATNTYITITNHNPTTGVTTLTAGGAVPQGATILLGYLGS